MSEFLFINLRFPKKKKKKKNNDRTNYIKK